VSSDDTLRQELLAHVPPDLRTAAGEAWADAALSEHSSVASFARFVQELMALGAPPTLIEGALQAARDEVEHARASFGIASHLLGVPVGPGPLPAQAARDLSIADLARTTLEEACVDESLGAIAAEEAARHCVIPSVRAVLEKIAVEEARHADLAWQTVGWALSMDPVGVRAVLHSWHAELPADVRDPAASETDAHTNALLKLGVVSDAWLHRNRPAVETTVVRPVLEQLLDAVDLPIVG
jgi:hypothetical protein